jgi:hypothetical protein
MIYICNRALFTTGESTGVFRINFHVDRRRHIALLLLGILRHLSHLSEGVAALGPGRAVVAVHARAAHLVSVMRTGHGTIHAIRVHWTAHLPIQAIAVHLTVHLAAHLAGHGVVAHWAIHVLIQWSCEGSIVHGAYSNLGIKS